MRGGVETHVYSSTLLPHFNTNSCTVTHFSTIQIQEVSKQTVPSGHKQECAKYVHTYIRTYVLHTVNSGGPCRVVVLVKDRQTQKGTVRQSLTIPPFTH